MVQTISTPVDGPTFNAKLNQWPTQLLGSTYMNKLYVPLQITGPPWIKCISYEFAIWLIHEKQGETSKTLTCSSKICQASIILHFHKIVTKRQCLVKDPCVLSENEVPPIEVVINVSRMT